jgi:hypothetical protein
MFTNDITLAGDSSSTRTYALRSITDGNSVRANASASATLPETLQVKHQLSSRGGVPLDRHLVRLDLGLNSANQGVVSPSVYLTIEVPRDPIVTVAIIKDMKTQLVNFLATSGYVDKLLNGEP